MFFFGPATAIFIDLRILAVGIRFLLADGKEFFFDNMIRIRLGNDMQLACYLHTMVRFRRLFTELLFVVFADFVVSFCLLLFICILPQLRIERKSLQSVDKYNS
jgi:hypothetical protein